MWEPTVSSYGVRELADHLSGGLQSGGLESSYGGREISHHLSGGVHSGSVQTRDPG